MIFLMKTTAFTIGLLAVHLAVTQAGPYLLSDDRIRDLDATPVLGRGYSIMTNTFRSSCIETSSTTTPSYNYDQYNVDFTDVLDKHAVLNDKLATSFSFTKIKDEFNSPEDDAFADPKYYFASVMRIDRFYSSVEEQKSALTEDAQAILTAQDYIGFFKSCGSNYVRGIRRAQEVVGFFIFPASTKQLAQEFAKELKTVSSQGGVAATDAAVAPVKTDQAKYDSIRENMEIRVTAFGLGLGGPKGTLVASTLSEYHNIMDYAFKAMTQTADGKNVGMVYGVEVVPWVDNMAFQVAALFFTDEIKIPISRSLLQLAYRTDDRTNTAFVEADRELFTCRQSSYKIDMYGYCCQDTSMYFTDELKYNRLGNFTLAICRPERVLDKSIVKNNMSTNAEFVTRLDAAIRFRLNAIATLKKCIHAVRDLPDTLNYNLLKPQESIRYEYELAEEFTVYELKLALDPTKDHGLVKHLGSEFDEYMDMFYMPCVHALLGSKIGKSVNTDSIYFMAYPWHSYSECSALDCLSRGMRWNRDTGGCVDSLIKGPDAPGYTTNDSKCTYDTEIGDATGEVCRFTTTDLSAFHTEAVGCWNNTLSTRSVDKLIEHYCMPSVIDAKLDDTKTTELQTKIETNCPKRWVA